MKRFLHFGDNIFIVFFSILAAQLGAFKFAWTSNKLEMNYVVGTNKKIKRIIKR